MAGALAWKATQVTLAGDRGDERRPLGGGDVLALVDVAVAGGAEARVRAAEAVRARIGEDAGRRDGGGGHLIARRSWPDALAVLRSPWPPSSNAFSVTV